MSQPIMYVAEIDLVTASDGYDSEDDDSEDDVSEEGPGKVFANDDKPHPKYDPDGIVSYLI